MSKANYYFGRIHIEDYADRDKKEFLLQGFLARITLDVRNVRWGFFRIQEIQDTELGNFILGYLVRYDPETEVEIALPDSHEISEEIHENQIVAKSHFLLHVKSGIIAYRLIGSIIDNRKFIDRFSRLIEKAHDQLFVSVAITAITERFEFLQDLKKFQAISKLEISLYPSNPNNYKLWKTYDDHIRKVGATSYNEKYLSNLGKAGNSGLKLEDDDEITNKILMAEDGYGTATAEGITEEGPKEISTDKAPVSVRIDSANDEPQGILNSIKFKLKAILERFKNE